MKNKFLVVAIVLFLSSFAFVSAADSGYQVDGRVYYENGSNGGLVEVGPDFPVLWFWEEADAYAYTTTGPFYSYKWNSTSYFGFGDGPGNNSQWQNVWACNETHYGELRYRWYDYGGDCMAYTNPDTGCHDIVINTSVKGHPILDPDNDGICYYYDDCEANDSSCNGGLFELCNGEDDNNNTLIDDGFDVGEMCSNGQRGVCSITGVKVCNGQFSTTCNAPDGSGNAVYEICGDGLDNDCDGYADARDSECICVSDEIQICGSDVGECSLGNETCIDGYGWGECVGSIGPTPEVNDGLDNDCDGDIDNCNPADITGDGFVDVEDLDILKAFFGSTNCSYADINDDGRTNLADFVILRSNYGAGNGTNCSLRDLGCRPPLPPFAPVAEVVAPVVAAASSSDFVSVDGTDFILDSEPFYFAGANAYYLWYSDVDCSNPNLRQGCAGNLLEDAKDLNLSVIRTWASSEGGWGYRQGFNFQPSAGVYDEATLVNLDKVVKEAKDRDLKLMLVLSNNWDSFGGMCQYVKWCGLPDAEVCKAGALWPFGLPVEVHDEFYTNNCTRDLFKDYVSNLLERVNTQTGVKYKDEPAIFAWELANEPRARTDRSGVTLTNWINEMSAFVKSIDSNHLVTGGVDGGYVNKDFTGHLNNWWHTGGEGQDFFENHASDNIDFATFNYYDKNFDVNETLWIEEHVTDAHAVIGKPVILQEFNTIDGINRVVKIRNIYSMLENLGANGDAFWMLSDFRDADQPDNFEILCPEDVEMCPVLSDHANYMNSLNSNVECTIEADCDHLDTASCSGTVITQDNGVCVNNVCEVESVELEDCSDGLFCNGDETCSNGACVAGTVVDCSVNNLFPFGKCDNNPDNNLLTWDSFGGFNSVCNDNIDSCTTGIVNVTSSCDVAGCGAECSVNIDCDDGNAGTIDTCSGCSCEYEVVEENCTVPVDGMNITESVTFCRGNYTLSGGINILGSDLILDCSGGTLFGDYYSIGIYLENESNVIIKNCSLIDFDESIEVKSGRNVTISENYLHDGLRFNGDSSYISGNIIYTGKPWAHSLAHSLLASGTDLVISDNVIYGQDHSMRLWGLSNSRIINNTVSGYVWGRIISLDTVENSIFESNTIKNGYGVYCWYGCENNILRENDFVDNALALDCSGPWGWYNTTIYHNNFGDNNISGECFSSFTNKLDFNNEGNYWSNYDSVAEGCSDVDNDGICDSPYNLSVGVLDNFPFSSENGWLPRPWCDGADMNRDGRVGLNDFVIVRGNFGLNCSAPGWCSNADIDMNGVVDDWDLNIFKANFGKGNCVGDNVAVAAPAVVPVVAPVVAPVSRGGSSNSNSKPVPVAVVEESEEIAVIKEISEDVFVEEDEGIVVGEDVVVEEGYGSFLASIVDVLKRVIVVLFVR